MMTRAQYMSILLPLAERFVGVIHDEGPQAASDVLEAVYAVPRPPGVVASRALMTILAAMVSMDTTRSARLDWVRALDQPERILNVVRRSA